MNTVDWNEQFKIRIRRNASRKHETIKTLLCINLIEKFKNNPHWIKVYTEYPIGTKKICDVYFENTRTREIICFEIQNNVSKKWTEETTKAYSEIEKSPFTVDWVLIKEKDMSENIKELDEQIRRLVE